MTKLLPLEDSKLYTINNEQNYISLNFQDKDFGIGRDQSGAVHHSYHYQLHHLQNIEKEGTAVTLDGH